MNRPVSCCALVAATLFSCAIVAANSAEMPTADPTPRADLPANAVDTAPSLDAATRVIHNARQTGAPSTTEGFAHLATQDRDPKTGAPRDGDTGACCFGEPTCDIVSEADCINEGLNWIGPGTTCDECPQLPSCSGDSLFAQSPGNPFEFEGGSVSEQSANLKRYEYFYQIVGPIKRVNFYGFDLGITPGGAFFECVEPDNTFEIAFYPDVGGRPGEATCTYTLTATRTPTGVYYIDGFELNEYEVILPQACVMTRGWISVVGMGDPTCFFVWSSPPSNVGDDLSVCEGCTSIEQGMDLAFCLRGTFAGVFGACCDEATGTCTDNVEIFQCIGSTQRFTPNTTCAELSPGCGIPTGACCGGDITRGTLCVDGVVEADCPDPDKEFLPNSVCRFLEPACGEPIGPCCVGTLSCVVTSEDVCDAEGWTWLGPGLTCDDCPAQTPCPPNTLFAQPPLDIGQEPTLYTSESSRGAIVFDDFSAVAGTITDIQFYGVDLMPIGPASFIECEETVPDFSVTFYEDQGHAPGPVVSSQLVSAVRTPTGIIYRGAEYNLYQAELPEPVVMTRGWISIVGEGSPTCYFLWAPSTDNAGGSVRDLPEFNMPIRQNNSFAFCLIGTAGGVTGACCNQATGTCSNGIAIENCIGVNDRFAADGTCAINLADCGVPRGACCLGALACQFVTDADCSILGGEFLGVNSACLECPCKVFCDPQAISEGEADCSSSFEDVTNPGCDSQNPTFTMLQLNERYCGTTGIDFEGESLVVDTDWYEIVADDFLNLSYRFECESPATIRFIDGTNGCPGFLLDGASASACSPVELFEFVAPGTYWIQIEPQGPSDASACGAAYELTPLNTPCDADFDFDRDVDMIDFSYFQPQFNLSGGGLFGDLNGDGVIDIADVHLFEQELGTTCP